MRLRPAAAASFVGFAALLATAACIDPIKPENAIYIEFAVNRTEFAAGDSLYVTSRAVNTINEPVKLQRACGRIFEVRVRSTAGKEVFNSSAVSAECATDAPDVTLPGDGEVTETYARAGLVASPAQRSFVLVGADGKLDEARFRALAARIDKHVMTLGE